MPEAAPTFCVRKASGVLGTGCIQSPGFAELAVMVATVTGAVLRYASSADFASTPPGRSRPFRGQADHSRVPSSSARAAAGAAWSSAFPRPPAATT